MGELPAAGAARRAHPRGVVRGDAMERSHLRRHGRCRWHLLGPRRGRGIRAAALRRPGGQARGAHQRY